MKKLFICTIIVLTILTVVLILVLVNKQSYSGPISAPLDDTNCCTHMGYDPLPGPSGKPPPKCDLNMPCNKVVDPRRDQGPGQGCICYGQGKCSSNGCICTPGLGLDPRSQCATCLDGYEVASACTKNGDPSGGNSLCQVTVDDVIINTKCKPISPPWSPPPALKSNQYVSVQFFYGSAPYTMNNNNCWRDQHHGRAGHPTFSVTVSGGGCSNLPQCVSWLVNGKRKDFQLACACYPSYKGNPDYSLLLGTGDPNDGVPLEVVWTNETLSKWELVPFKDRFNDSSGNIYDLDNNGDPVKYRLKTVKSPVLPETQWVGMTADGQLAFADDESYALPLRLTKALSVDDCGQPL